MIEARVRARRIACQVRAAHYLPQVMATQAAFSTAVLRASLVAPIALLLPQLGVGATLEGRVQYPGRAIPAATVYARNTETAALHSLALRRNEATFRFELPPGKYWVFVRPAEPGLTELYGAHTSYSTCRQRPAHLVDACTDHAILEVEVGTTPRRAPLELDDWFLDEGSAAALDRILGTAPPAPDEAGLGRPRFSEYRTAAGAPLGAVKLDLPPGSKAAGFARELKSAAEGGANFAASFAIARLACGAGCEQVAVVDLTDGAVVFPETLAKVPTTLPCRANEALSWRDDSRLLEFTHHDDETIVTDYLLWDAERHTFTTLAQYRRNLERFCGGTD